MKVHPASHITNFPAKENRFVNLQATGQALNLNTQDFENSFFYLSLVYLLQRKHVPLILRKSIWQIYNLIKNTDGASKFLRLCFCLSAI